MSAWGDSRARGAVDLGQVERAAAARPDQGSELVRPAVGDDLGANRVPVGGGERDQAPAALLHVGRGLAVDQDDERAGGPRRRTAVGGGPGQGGAVGLRRVGGGQDDHIGRVGSAASVLAGERIGGPRVPGRPQPVDGARDGELGGTQPGHEVAATDRTASSSALSTG